MCLKSPKNRYQPNKFENIDFQHGVKNEVALLVKVLLQFQICNYAYNRLAVVICEKGMFITLLLRTLNTTIEWCQSQLTLGNEI